MTPTQEKKTCFLVSPIGKEGTDVRQAADDLFDLLVQPALEPFGFDVVRADRIPRPSVITSDIVQLVQTAELCIIDLTGHNPNVFYECGRRHETGRPFIQLIKKGENLPFDVAGIRTIPYDLTNPRTTRESVVAVQDFVRDLEVKGYEERSSGESLSTIATALERIERKLNQVIVPQPGPSSGAPGEADADPVKMLEFQANPEKGYMVAIHKGDYTQAHAMLPLVARSFGNCEKTILAAGLLAQFGDSLAADILTKALQGPTSGTPTEALAAGCTALSGYYMRLDREKEGLVVMVPLIERILKTPQMTREDEATVLNSKQRLLFGAGEYEQALPVADRMLQLAPDTTAYQYNTSLLYWKMNMPEKCLSLVDKFMQKPDEELDEDHMAHAADRYREAGRIAEAKQAINRLKIKDPYVARRILAAHPELKA